jgi:hypothetical protein
LALPVAGQPRELFAVNETIRAAQADGIRALNSEISRLPLAAGWTVGRFLSDFDTENQFPAELAAANQIGAPRWVENTCQVQLRIAQVRVVRALQRIAATQGRRSPLTAFQIERASQTWPDHAFDVTGTSALPEALKHLRPVAGDPWVVVPDEARKAALDRAAEAAIRTAMDSIKGVRLVEGRTLGDALAVEQAANPVKQWLATRPVRRVDFRGDLQVEVMLAVDPETFYETVRQALEGQKAVALPKDEQEWARFEREFLKQIKPAVGQAGVGAGQGAGAARPPAAFHWPAAAPRWATQELEVVGRAEARSSTIKTIGAADADAAANLRQKIAALPLGQGMTVGKLAERDRAVAASVDEFVSVVRSYQTTQNADGSVTVALRVDLRDLWEALQH